MKKNIETLNDIIDQVSQATPDKIAYRFLNYSNKDEIDTTVITYKEFAQQVRIVANYLQQIGATGHRALLLYLPSLDYIISFFGCLAAGVIAVPVYVPLSTRQFVKLKYTAYNCQARFILTTGSIIDIAGTMDDFEPYFGHIRLIATDEIPHEADKIPRKMNMKKDSLAFLQYTSGSTSKPRGVMVTHENLLHNLSLIVKYFQLDSSIHEVSWLPPYHDMGLIGGILVPLYLGGCGTFMSPLDFLQKPFRWLQAISTYKSNVSGGPNFAYDLCVKKITPEQIASLDLSTWGLAFNGAEVIRPDTLDSFSRTFKHCGFRKEALYPCYGMAEATLLVSGGDRNSRPVIANFDSNQLSRGTATTAQKESASTALVGCGGNLASQQIIIVDPKTSKPCPDGTIGEIWISGPSVASGYWNQPEAYVDKTFQARTIDDRGPYLRSGDLGFLNDGELFVTGRLKDLIVIMGKNHYPHDIEHTIAAFHPACRPGCGAAFIVDTDGGEKVVVIQEVHKTYADKIDLNWLSNQVKAQVSKEHGIGLHKLVLIKHGSIPKTSSGKLQRQECKKTFLSDKLKALKLPKDNVFGDIDIRPGKLRAKNVQTRSIEKASSLNASAVETWLINYFAGKLKTSPSQIDIHAPLYHFAPSSLDVMIVSGDLEQWISKRVPPTLLYDYPTIALLAESLTGSGYTISTAKHQDRLTGASNLDIRSQDVAIVGIGCRFPGRANSPAEYWELLKNAAHAVQKLPAGRSQLTGVLDNSEARISYGGYIDDVEKFDAAFFNVLRREAEATDPQQRLLLETSWHAFEDAGIKPSVLAGSRTGVFIGIASADYAHLYRKTLTRTNVYSGVGNALSLAANRISYFYNFCGPSLAIDTACSSSLMAVHQACGSLCSGESDLALAGGVNLILDQDISSLLTRSGMLSSDGKCKAFDRSANGYVRGEGCGIVVLKRLADAIKDGDEIVAVIAGSAANQDGRSNGITAPNGPAQENLIAHALRQAAITADQIGYVEAHGTGTSLGDPIEVNALIKTLAPNRTPEQRFYIGSVKTNIGHLEAAAGIAGLIKTALCLKHGLIVPNLHLQEINPQIAIGDAPVAFPEKLEDFPISQKGGYAGISSFSFGGSNVHVILKGWHSEIPAVAESSLPNRQAISPKVLITLSAPNEERLKCVAAALRDYIKKALQNSPSGVEAVNLVDLAYSLQYFREAMPVRLAFVIADTETLLQRLTDFCENVEPMGVIFKGNAKRDKELIENSIKEKSCPNHRNIMPANHPIEHFAHLWVCGFNPDWNFLYRNLRPRRIPLPLYPFGRQRCWVQFAAEQRQADPCATHYSLLGRLNKAASLRSGILFENVLTPDLPFLTNYIIHGQNVLPGIYFAEIALAAVAEIDAGQNTVLKRIIWFSPLTMGTDPVKLSTLITQDWGELNFEITSITNQKRILHAKGSYEFSDGDTHASRECFPIEHLIKKYTLFSDRKCIYRAIGKAGLVFNPNLQVLDEVRCRIDTNEAIGTLRNINHPGDITAHSQYLPLCLADGAIQTAGVLSTIFSNTTYKRLMIPYAANTIEIVSRQNAICHSYVRNVGENQFDVALLNNAGKVCVKITGMAFREFKDPIPINYLPGRNPVKLKKQKVSNIFRSSSGIGL